MPAFTGRIAVPLGPLTTTWTMPEFCSIHVLGCTACSKGYRGQQCLVENGTTAPQDHTTCWPPMTARAGSPTHPFVGLGLYSPGLVCPMGYTTACTAEYGGRSGWEMQFSLIPGETAVGCCPEGFKCSNIFGNTCIAVETNLVATTALCSGTQMVDINQVTIPLSVDVTTTIIDTAAENTMVTNSLSRVSMMAPMFQLNYKASDVQTAPTSTASSQPTRPTTGTGPRPTHTKGGSSGGGSGGLSTGAIAGIAVGAVLGGILLGALAILFFIRHRKQAGQAQAEQQQGTQSTGEPPSGYYYGASVPGHATGHKFGEMDAGPAASEMSGGYVKLDHYHGGSHPDGTPWTELSSLREPGELPGETGQAGHEWSSNPHFTRPR
ncbi:hypothetical protein B0J18DRAFT_8261 [Chaetomium sp. MPI-SDFR-AT-0129]|nr:hypothetical protein B0J18DRAFT_8261 [Chaetomium sp. MPI-SDFR-AT-0129]